MNKLRMVYEFLAPSTPVGFLVYGWLGACLALGLIPMLMAATGTWITGVIFTLIVYVPLWVRADRKRDEQAKLHATVDELVNTVEKKIERQLRKQKEENERNDNNATAE